MTHPTKLPKISPEKKNTVENMITKIDQLEKDLQKIEDILVSNGKLMEKINYSLNKISTGLYGDIENNYPGVIKKTQELEEWVEEIDGKILAIEKKNNEQDLILNAKNELKINWMNIGKHALRIIIEVGVIYAVVSGNADIFELLGK